MRIKVEALSMESGFIYRIHCIPTGKNYIGQAKEHKYKNNKPYKYGIQGRWNDHICSAKSSITQFADAIRFYGKDAFQVEELEKAKLIELDALEAKWIAYYKSLIPHGFNIARHSQTKNRQEGNLHEFFRDKAEKAVLRRINKDGIPKLVYVYVYMKDGTQRRISFGQNKNDTFEDAYNSAIEFVNKIGCVWSEDTSSSSDPLERYAKKIEEYSAKDIIKIKITSASSLIAVYITTSDATSWKDQERICFGGKTIEKNAAYDIACLFVKSLKKSNQTIIQDVCQSPQQATAPMGEVSP